jgi:hypothetical protein
VQQYKEKQATKTKAAVVKKHFNQELNVVKAEIQRTLLVASAAVRVDDEDYGEPVTMPPLTFDEQAESSPVDKKEHKSHPDAPVSTGGQNVFATESRVPLFSTVPRNETAEVQNIESSNYHLTVSPCEIRDSGEAPLGPEILERDTNANAQPSRQLPPFSPAGVHAEQKISDHARNHIDVERDEELDTTESTKDSFISCIGLVSGKCAAVILNLTWHQIPKATTKGTEEWER